jgi:tetratricopeptide (TPR) repeat protein
MQHQAQGLAAYLFRRELLKEDVPPALLALKTISEPVRQAALAQARLLENDVDLINEACGDVVLATDRPPEEYRRVLRCVEEAARLEPDKGYIVQNVGFALYRLGRYEEAATVFRRTYEMNPPNSRNANWDLLFLAMAEHKLGRHDDARATFKRVRPGTVVFKTWREAQELIEGKGAEPRK